MPIVLMAPRRAWLMWPWIGMAQLALQRLQLNSVLNICLDVNTLCTVGKFTELLKEIILSKTLYCHSDFTKAPTENRAPLSLNSLTLVPNRIWFPPHPVSLLNGWVGRGFRCLVRVCVSFSRCHQKFEYHQSWPHDWKGQRGNCLFALQIYARSGRPGTAGHRVAAVPGR